GADKLTVYQEMLDSVTGVVAAAYSIELEMRDLHTHAACSLPAAVQARASELLVSQPEHGRAKGLTLAAPRPLLTLEQAEAMGMVPTFQSQIRPEQCDRWQRLTLRHFMGIMS